MLPLMIVFLLGFGSVSGSSTDSVDITPTRRTIVVFGPPSHVVDSLSHSKDFTKAYSAFNESLGKVVEYMREKDVLIQEATAHVIRMRSRKGEIDRIMQGQFTDREGNDHLFGLIVVDPGNAPLVIFGVHTDESYIEAIEKYFRVR